MTSAEPNVWVDEGLAASIRLLRYRLEHPPTSERAISTAALERMVLVVESLQYVDEPAADPDIRRMIRMLTTLIPDEVPDSRVPDIITQVLDHPGLVFEDVRDILAGNSLEAQSAKSREVSFIGASKPLSAYKLREVASLLRWRALQDGRPRDLELRAIAEVCGVSLDVPRDVSIFLGVVEARSERLADAAAEWIAAGRDATAATEFGRRHNIGTKMARRLLQQAAEDP